MMENSISFRKSKSSMTPIKNHEEGMKIQWTNLFNLLEDLDQDVRLKKPKIILSRLLKVLFHLAVHQKEMF